jgi:Protein of unknown function (DUF3261)
VPRELALYCALALALGCKTFVPPAPLVALALPKLASCAGGLRSTDEIEGDWIIHERMRVVGDGVDESFGLVLQKSGPKLVLLGLTPFGAKAFGVTQIGVETWVETYLPTLAVPPENVLRDVHRAHFLIVDDPALDARALSRDADGVIHIAARACGYEATLAPVSAVLPGAKHD